MNTELQIIDPEKVSVKPNLGLKEEAEKLGRTLIYTSYVTDRKLAIAKINEQGKSRIAVELTNEVDWKKDYLGGFAVTDILITGADYLKRLQELGPSAQNILNMMTEGKFAYLGDKRVELGLKKEPDVAILSRSLDFPLPDQIKVPNRKIIVFTTDQMADSEVADQLRKQGLKVYASGREGADGKRISDYLTEEGYKTAMMTTGPRVLQVFMDAKRMDDVFLTVVDTEVSGQTVNILPEGKDFEDYGYKLVSTEGPDLVKTNSGEIHRQTYQKWVSPEVEKVLAG